MFPTSTSSPSGISVATSQNHPSFAVDQNTDPNYMTITDQTVRWTAPNLGPYENIGSYFILNAQTEASYFMQVGQQYGTNGLLGWTDNTTGPTGRNLVFQPWSYPVYTAGHKYLNSITRSTGTNPVVWTLQENDYNTGQYNYVSLSGSASVVGTHFVFSRNTSVWFENYNTVTNWYSNFTNPITVDLAFDRGMTAWQGDSQSVWDCHLNQQPINGTITGYLSGFGTASWHLDKILLGCSY